MSIVRFGVSIKNKLLKALENYASEKQYTDCSQAIRNLINNKIITGKWQCNYIVSGSIPLVYDDHKRDLLADLQHDSRHVILSSKHFHLEHDLCMEIIAEKGKAITLNALTDKMIAGK